ncbi:MAG: hypothetical protein H7124_11755 [Phycisphaerales bacterium]|nr:hypothetical protein [Hyphomonadaceae bacterium]
MELAPGTQVGPYRVDALIARGGGGAQVLLTRAAALAKLGRKKEADAAYAEAQQRWPNDPRVKARQH